MDGDASAHASSDAGLTPELCTTMCDLTFMVVCPGQPAVDACNAKCQSEISSPCASLEAVFFRCFVANGKSGATCDPSLGIVPTPGKCMQESGALKTCLFSQSSASGRG
jgi:hypothetical protein